MLVPFRFLRFSTVLKFLEESLTVTDWFIRGWHVSMNLQILTFPSCKEDVVLNLHSALWHLQDCEQNLTKA